MVTSNDVPWKSRLDWYLRAVHCRESHERVSGEGAIQGVHSRAPFSGYSVGVRGKTAGLFR